MRLTFPAFDGRSFNLLEIIDEDTGQQVGRIESNGVGPGRFGGINVSLFDDKYRCSFNHRDECYGFVKGVEAALRHMMGNYPLVKATKSTAA